MKPYDAEHVFNVALVSHGGAGKTSLVEAMLFRSGAITRLGSVEEGNTTSDFDPDEVKRGMSVSLAVAPAEWQGQQGQPARHARATPTSSARWSRRCASPMPGSS